MNHFNPCSQVRGIVKKIFFSREPQYVPEEYVDQVVCLLTEHFTGHNGIIHTTCLQGKAIGVVGSDTLTSFFKQL